tara:strand:+ start:3495 stop:7637 length:4143 start_codon:yes stop_codon:yes gene_type:complete
MARISTYSNDNTINDYDLLAGSNYLGTKNGVPGAPAQYSTKNFKLKDLAEYFATFWLQDGSLYNFSDLDQSITTNTSSIATANVSITTNATDISASATKVTNLGASFGVMGADGTMSSFSESFANQVLNVATSTDYASAAQLTSLTSTVTTNGNAITGNTASISTANTSITTNATAITASASDITSLTSTVTTQGSTLSGHTTSIATANSGITTNATAITSSASDITSLTSTVNTQGNTITGNTSSISTANSNISTNATAITSSASSITALTSTVNTQGSTLAGHTTSIATANTNISTNATNVSSNASSVTSLTSNLALKPDVFRQDDPPAVTKPVGSIWYDTNDNNKVYVLVAGSPNVWTESTDGRIVTNINSLATANSSISTNATNIASEAAKVTELKTQFTYSGDNITGVNGSEALNTVIDTARSTAESASATKIDTLGAKFYTNYNNATGAGTLKEAFANSIFTTTTNTDFATASAVTSLTTTVNNKPLTFRQDAAPSVSSPLGSIWFDSNDSNKIYILVTGSPNVWTETFDGRIASNTSSIGTANTNIGTNSTNITSNATATTNLTSTVTSNKTGQDLIPLVYRQDAAPATTVPINSLWYDTNDGNKLYLLKDVSGTNTWTATIDATMATNTGNITTNATTIAARPKVFRQDAAPGVTEPVNSVWYDTDADNKPYVLVSGSPNVWTETADSRVGTVVTGLAAANTTIGTHTTTIAAEAVLVDELQAQFTYSGANINGVADALNTSINTASSTAAGAVATDLDKLEAVFAQSGDGTVTGTAGVLSTAVTTSANAAITNASLASAADVTELKTQFAYSGANITGVADTLNTVINTAQSDAESASATKINSLASNFFTGYNNANGTFTAVNVSEAFANDVFTTTTNTDFASTSSVNTLSSTISEKPSVFRQDAEPAVTGATGSIWYDTNDGNKLYVLIAGTPKVWTATIDSSIATAQSTADGRPKVFRQASAPGTSEPAGSIWYDTDDNNKNYVLVSSTWTAVADGRIATNAASIITNAGTIATVEGYAESRYSLQATAGGVVTGMSILAANGATTNTSEVKFQADKFIVNSSSTNLTPFSISGSKIAFNGDLTVTGTALIQGAFGSGDFIACKFKNTDTTNAYGAGISLNSSSDYHHRILMTGGTTTTVNGTSAFDLSASYQLGLDSSYSKQIVKLNGAGLIIPNQTANGVTPAANYSGGMNIIFNENAGARTAVSGRLHVNEYMKTFFVDVPESPRTDGDYPNMSFVIRKFVTASPTNYDDKMVWVKSSTNSLHVKGDIVASESSDERLKDNIKPIENAIDKIDKIGGYEFDWNDKQELYKGHDVGVIAQEIEKVLPEIVETREDGYKAVDYKKIVPLLIQAIKEQQKQIEELKNK